MPISPEYDSPMELTTDSAPVPVTPAPAPSPEAPTVEPKVETPAADPAKPVVEKVETGAETQLFDLPDGRKVDAATLSKEFKENFLPDYTRKSQELANYKNNPKPQDKPVTNPPTDAPKWKDPSYVPETYAEVIEIATQEAQRRISEGQSAEQARTKAIQDAVEGDLSALKANDPKLDENALFQHANKYGFQDLKSAYKNMKDIQAATLDAEQRTLKNIKTRDADPIAGGDSGTSVPGDGVDMGELSGFSNAVEFLQRAKGK